MNDDQAHFHSLQEAQDALNGLSLADWHRLDKAAAFQVFCYPQISGEDLLQETVDRILLGKRNWKIGVPFPIFFYHAMRSIADEWREDATERIEVTEADLPLSEDDEPPDLAKLARTWNADPAVALQVKQVVADIEAKFVETDAELSFLLGQCAGQTAKETQTEYGLTPQEYGAASKRWERWLKKHYPEGLKDE